MTLTPAQFRQIGPIGPAGRPPLTVTPEQFRAARERFRAAQAAAQTTPEPQKAGMPKWFPFVLGGAALVVIGALAMRRKPRVEVLPPRAKPELPSP
jgi:hypothetical protein